MEKELKDLKRSVFFLHLIVLFGVAMDLVVTVQEKFFP